MKLTHLIAGLLCLCLATGPTLAASGKKKPSKKRQPTGLKQEGAANEEKKEAPQAVEKAAEKTVPAPETKKETAKGAPAEVRPDTELDELANSLLDDVEREQLAVSARFDLAFLTGNSVTQGFSLPSLRVSIYGDVTSILSYRVSVGQTREFTSALLPQLIPVEAYMDLGSSDTRSKESRFSIRVGMFTPSQNPFWTPDLSDLPLPSYNRTHRELYLFRDLGAELRYESASRNIEASVAAVNGIGIFAQNTNNSKAGALYLKGRIPFGEWNFYAGAGGMGLLQSVSGNVNYKRNWVLTGFIGVTSRFGILQGEYSVGEFETSTTYRNPTGGALMAFARISDQLKMFVRYENLVNPPTGGSGTLKVFQVGPVLELHETLTLFGTYTQTQESDGSALTHAGEVRFRLNV
ncbi:MAG: hypothetical protein H6617_06545 [Bdellovibrionaceae bacterium]|nr:hypothetical protein [Bdellovibrionales bacterium]MCB9254324.1 hypothetical protein [Pseudobdellovibrionaceae bacterium]